METKEEKKIYIVLSMTGTRVCKFLKIAGGLEYPHVSLSLSKDLSKLYSFGRRNLWMPLIGGFVKEEIDHGVYQKYDTDCNIFELTVSEEKYRMIEEMIEKFKADYPKYRYNFIGLACMKLDIPFERKWHFVCSQFVAYLLMESDVASFGKSFSLVGPEDFLTISGKEKIYEGLLKEYVLANRCGEQAS